MWVRSLFPGLAILLLVMEARGQLAEEPNLGKARAVPEAQVGNQLPPLPPAPAAGRPTFVGQFGRGAGNPNVISIGAVLESQEAIAQYLQVSIRMPFYRFRTNPEMIRCIPLAGH